MAALPLACDIGLSPLPVHVIYRNDPTSVVAAGVWDEMFDHIDHIDQHMAHGKF